MGPLALGLLWEVMGITHSLGPPLTMSFPSPTPTPTPRALHLQVTGPSQNIVQSPSTKIS